MATRSMVVLCARSGVSIHLYRHWDGYPAIAGVALLEALNSSSEVAGVAKHLMAQGDEQRRDYELADWPPDQQGDLEHVYVVNDLRVGKESMPYWSVEHYARPSRAWGVGDEKYTRWPSIRYTLENFAAFVTKEREAMERRIAEYEKRQAAVSAS